MVLPDDKFVVVTTDNAWNIWNATKILSWHHFGQHYQLGVKKTCRFHKSEKHLDYIACNHFHQSSKSL